MNVKEYFNRYNVNGLDSTKGLIRIINRSEVKNVNEYTATVLK